MMPIFYTVCCTLVHERIFFFFSFFTSQGCETQSTEEQHGRPEVHRSQPAQLQPSHSLQG